MSKDLFQNDSKYTKIFNLATQSFKNKNKIDDIAKDPNAFDEEERYIFAVITIL